MNSNAQLPEDGTRKGASRGFFQRFLATVEYLGNLLPHPVTLFAIFALVTILLSGVAAHLTGRLSTRVRKACRDVPKTA